jgi:hypothetical protein
VVQVPGAMNDSSPIWPEQGRKVGHGRKNMSHVISNFAGLYRTT